MLTCAQKLTARQVNVAHGTNKKEQNKNPEKLRKISASEESVESTVRVEERLQWEGFVKEIHFKSRMMMESGESMEEYEVTVVV